MTHPVFGLRIVHGTINYFINNPAQALPEHLDVVTEAYQLAPLTDKSVIVRDNQADLTITACRTYADVAKWVVLEDTSPQSMDHGIFATMWTPESPRPLEIDHNGVDRFVILDFAEDKIEANNIVSILRSQKGK